MRKQIAAANWKMNLSYQEGEKLLDDLLQAGINIKDNHYALFAVPFPYLEMAARKLSGRKNIMVAAQNCHQQKSGAYTGEVSAAMLRSMGVEAVLIGHSERREYAHEDNALLAEKINRALEEQLLPVFCCGEALPVREAGHQNEFVARQLEESLYHLDKETIEKLVIAYEPIWAIGTGKTATAAQAQEMHAHLRSVLAARYGADVAARISILYGGSVKGNNAAELFGQSDVDGGLVGGASLSAPEFHTIMSSLQ
jgi:triosephosphate isomerase (TIM)